MPHEWVLIVEDDDGLRSLLSDELQDAGLETHTAPSAEEAKAVLKERRPALVISDIRLPGADGMALLREVLQQDHAPAFIIITAFGSIAQAVEALKAGADDFLTKPLDLEHLRLSMDRTLENQRLRQRVKALDAAVGEAPFHGMVGRSKAMRQLFDTIRRVARASGPVLIEGESGTGKELVAQAVHQESPRAEGPFLAVSCGGVPADLLESEFFGHAQGGLYRRTTGARRARRRGQRRDAPARRDWGDAGGTAGQAAARAAGRHRAPGGQQPAHGGRRADSRLYQPYAARGGNP